MRIGAVLYAGHLSEVWGPDAAVSRREGSNQSPSQDDSLIAGVRECAAIGSLSQVVVISEAAYCSQTRQALIDSPIRASVDVQAINDEMWFRSALVRLQPCDVLMVHDVRAGVFSPLLVKRLVDALQRSSLAIVVAPVLETVKVVDSTGFVTRTLERDELIHVGSPWSMRWNVAEQMAIDVQRHTLRPGLAPFIPYLGDYRPVLVSAFETATA